MRLKLVCLLLLAIVFVLPSCKNLGASNTCHKPNAKGFNLNCEQIPDSALRYPGILIDEEDKILYLSSDTSLPSSYYDIKTMRYYPLSTIGEIPELSKRKILVRDVSPFKQAPLAFMKKIGIKPDADLVKLVSEEDGIRKIAAWADYFSFWGMSKLMNELLPGAHGRQGSFLKDGSFLITGGRTENGKSLKSAYLYNFTSKKMTALSDMLEPRVEHQQTVLDSGEVLITGGKNGRFILNSAEIFNPITHKFRLIQSMENHFADHHAILLKNGMILLFGGTSIKKSAEQGKWIETLTEASNKAEIFDPNTFTFEAEQDMKTGRERADAILLPNGQVLISGGGKWDKYGDGVSVTSSEIYVSLITKKDLE